MANPEDRNFDDIAEQFHRRIGNSLKGRLRRAVVRRDINECLSGFDAAPKSVLDAGGGYGQMAIQAALAGHRVHYCDLSEVMTGKAKEQARDAGVEHLIRFDTLPV